MAIIVDENHKKVIEITLWMLDEMLCKFDRWISNNDLGSVLYEEINPLSIKQRKEIKSEINASRALLVQIRDELSLKKHSEPIDRAIGAMSAVFAADDLVTIKGRQIVAYGWASSELTDYLEDKITVLISKLHKISSIASHGYENAENDHGGSW